MKRAKLTRRTGLKRSRWVYQTPRVADAVAHALWVHDVQERADFACERCSAKANRYGFCESGPLDPHHPWSRGRGGKDEEWNGVLLCRRCHRGVHDHTVDDWADWLASDEEGARSIRARLDAR